ncbi:glutamate transport system substrate-binding protein [Amycolatopsis xylanica]|uniref:Glutamate transport system substrate-binding protein n=1 Tax=Amycolatopsis xylanica TaxID=589385 RepID=A0A1H3PMX2_9PSEU|nr:glutamate ABC transporter substrate-binding protein [Amycolatopsis xylanica]SDZ02602.1 glutamate transport system substrate-binding protein [Amycolatopsis xylanica]
MRVKSLTTLGVVLVLLASCGSGGSALDSLVKRASDRNHLTIGTRFDQPGLSERTLDGRVVGFDIDVAKYVANELGVSPDEITWRETEPKSREPDISSGAVDMVVATYSITPARKQVVSFAGPYFVTGQDLLIRLNTPDITGPESLNGKKLCSVPGTTSADEVKRRYARAVELSEYPRYPACVTALLAGQVDAVTTDAPILAGYVTQNPELLKVVGQSFTVEKYGIGLRKGDVEGQNAVNAAIRKMITSGEWIKSLNANIGPSGYKLPAPPEVTETQ